MNYLLVVKVLGILLICEGIALFIPATVSLIYNEDCLIPFLVTILAALAAGGVFFSVKPKSKKIGYKDGFAIVTFGWIIASLIGALPFYIGGVFASYLDAIFETVSGFTTTGATVLEDIEIVPRGYLFWRSFTHWIGGMGILVLTLAIIPALGGSLQIFKAESPGPISDKIASTVSKTAKILYGTYTIITITEIFLLYLGGMTLFDACVHTFGTVGTGGFSSKNLSIGAFNSLYIDIVVSVFMIMSGTNFSLYFYLYQGKFSSFLKDEEFRFYIGVIIFSVIVVSLNLYGSVYKTMGDSLRYALFQVSSIMTTTGFTTADFDQWPDFSRGILLLLMFIGGCAGSTGGAIKHMRILLLLKHAKRELYKLLHPNAVISIKLRGKTVPEDIIHNISAFYFLFISIFAVITLIITTQGLDLISAASAVAATLGNIGPGLGAVGPVMNYADLTILTKTLLIGCMIMGRLEIYTVLVLLLPCFWKE